MAKPTEKHSESDQTIQKIPTPPDICRPGFTGLPEQGSTAAPSIFPQYFLPVYLGGCLEFFVDF
jgi:hypothetical protein